MKTPLVSKDCRLRISSLKQLGNIAKTLDIFLFGIKKVAQILGQNMAQLRL